MTSTTAEPSKSPSLLERARAAEPDVVVLRASALLVLHNSADRTVLQVVAVALLAVALRRRWIRHPVPWLAAATVSLAYDWTAWRGLDDHVILTHYWLLAIGLSLLAIDPAQSLERNGRLLVGGTFLFAVISKVAWGEVIDGSFYEATILTDTRFSWVAGLAGIDDPAANRAVFEGVHHAGTVALDGGVRLGVVAMALAIGTLILESLLALVFLAPVPGRVFWVRSALLGVFCVATYVIVPVAGFGGVLLAMAAADRRWGTDARLLHAAAMVVLLLWIPLWTALH